MDKKVTVGICAMESKSRSKPMRNILQRLLAYGDVDTILFGDKVLLDESAESWPGCDVLLSFFSTGFPLTKAIAYSELQCPFSVNDLRMQQMLLDRRLVLQMLDILEVPTPRRVIVSRDGGPVIEETLWKSLCREGFEIRDCRIQSRDEWMKRGRERELDELMVWRDRNSQRTRASDELLDDPAGYVTVDETAEEENKIKKRSPSMNSVELEKRMSGLRMTPLFGHKSMSNGPIVDFEQVDEDTIRYCGKYLSKPFVEKPVDGENHNIWIYYPKSSGGGVRKLFRKVANKSSEFVPDLWQVRTDGSYVYEEFMMVDNAEDVKVYTVGPEYIHAETRKSPVVDGIVRRTPDGKEMRFTTALSDEELTMAKDICVNFKQTVCGLDLLRANGKSYVIDVNGWSFVKGNDYYYEQCANALHNICLSVANNPHRPLTPLREPDGHWRLKAYLSVFRHADRTPKQKLKVSTASPFFIQLLNGSTEEVFFKKTEELLNVLKATEQALRNPDGEKESLELLQDVLERKVKYPGTKAQIKPIFSKEDGLLEKLQVVVKWGGEFTHAGFHHAKELGENLRKDLMIINKDVFSDIYAYCSSERRVMATADVILKAFLGIQEIPKPNAEGFGGVMTIDRRMLDDSNAAKDAMDKVKSRLRDMLTKPDQQPPLNDDEFAYDGEPAVVWRELVALLRDIRDDMTRKYEVLDVDSVQKTWCCSESPHLFRERWDRLFKDFCDVELSEFDPSKVPELHDSLKYDALHNREFIETMFVNEEKNKSDPRHMLRLLYTKSKQLFDFIGPREYGMTVSEKLEIGTLTSFKLLKQLISELDKARDMERGKSCTRFFFTKESHVHALYNVIRHCFPPGIQPVAELDYLTQITFELYVRHGNDGNVEHSLRIGFSPGAHDPGIIDTQMDYRHALSVAPRRWITDYIQLEDALFSLRSRMKTPHPSPRCTPRLELRRKSQLVNSDD